MNRDNKWTIITALIIAVVGVLLALHLKQHYDQATIENQSNKDKINIKNKNVHIYQNITYSRVFPNSKLDIITPSDMSSNTKLPVIFGCMAVGTLQVISNIKSIASKNC